MSNSNIPNLERMLFTLLVLGRRTSPHLWLVTPTGHTLSLDLRWHFDLQEMLLLCDTQCSPLNVTNINGNPWSGKTWGFHHALVHLKIKMNQKLTLLEAKNITLALAPQKGISKVSPGLECFLADLLDSCVLSTGTCPRHKQGNSTVEDGITQSVP